MAMPEDLYATLNASGRITAPDVVAIRRTVYPDMTVDPHEVEALFALNDAAVETCREWRDLFVEALTDYVVRQQSPAGYVDRAKADWLTARIVADGQVRSDTELELLIYILEQADQAPAALFELAIAQVKDFALTPERAGGDGPTLTADEVGRIRRILYAFAGSGGGASVSRAEAEVLFELNDAARERPNDPSWKELFSKAIGASIMAAPGYAALDRDEALRQQAWLKSPGDGVGSFYARMLGSMFDGSVFKKAQADDAGLWARNAKAEVEATAAAPVVDDEAAWLISRIGRDGALDGNEIAMLQFVKAQASSVHPSLQALIDQANVQAAPLATAPAGFGRRA